MRSLPSADKEMTLPDCLEKHGFELIHDGGTWELDLGSVKLRVNPDGLYIGPVSCGRPAPTPSRIASDYTTAELDSLVTLLKQMGRSESYPK